MEKMEWGPELETGILEIDTQHKRIVHLVNQMQEARMRKDKDTVATVFTEVVDCILSHFTFEEALMEDARYRFLGPHRRVHELFAKKIPEFQARFEADEDISNELHTTLVRWLYNHVRGDDRGYVESVKKFLEDTKAHAQSPKAYKNNVQAAILEIQAQRQPGFLVRLKQAFFPDRNQS
ncbi:MAG: bacteriohemerythrin [Desulfobulbaceae bacterium]|nr:bacteriohemerythrin [Desulfobulbaceae bacterium]